MAHDLGIDPETIRSRSDFKRRIAELDRQFDLVMITEHFEESLIMLKEVCIKLGASHIEAAARQVLCLQHTDILYVRKNTGNKPKPILGTVLEARFNDLFFYEVELYKHFHAKFRRKLSASIHKIRAEQRRLKMEHLAVSAFCERVELHFAFQRTCRRNEEDECPFCSDTREFNYMMFCKSLLFGSRVNLRMAKCLQKQNRTRKSARSDWQSANPDLTK